MSRRTIETCDVCGLEIPEYVPRLHVDVNIYRYDSTVNRYGAVTLSESEDVCVCGAACATRHFNEQFRTAMTPLAPPSK